MHILPGNPTNSKEETMAEERMEEYQRRLRRLGDELEMKGMSNQDTSLLVTILTLSMLLDALDDINLTLEKIANSQLPNQKPYKTLF